VTEGARRLGMPLRDYLILAKEAGLSSSRYRARSSTTEVRAVICPDRSTPRSGSRRTAPRTCRPALEHHDHVRYRRTSGTSAPHGPHARVAEGDRRFTEFVPLPFVQWATRSSCNAAPARPDDA